MIDGAVTCSQARDYYLRQDFLEYLLAVLPRRAVVLSTAYEPFGRYQQCRPRLLADSLTTLRMCLSSWLDRAFAGLTPDDVPPAYPSLHYAVGRHWKGGRDWVIEVDADHWQDAWRAVEPILGLVEALSVPYTLRYSGHCSPHVCLAEEDAPQPNTLGEALRYFEEGAASVQAALRKLAPAGAQVDLVGPIARLPYSLNETTGLVCIEVPRTMFGSFEPSAALPERVSISPVWPPMTRSYRASRLLKWAKGEVAVCSQPIRVFAEGADPRNPPSRSPAKDFEAEFTRLRAELLHLVGNRSLRGEGATSPPDGMVYMEGGPFISGSPWGVRELGEPVMTIAEAGPYFIDVLPVTNAEFTAFIRDGGYDREELWSAEGWEFMRACEWRGPSVPCDDSPGNFPVRGVSYFEAEAYARWAGKRLPTLAEWEKACRGMDGRRWPWGDKFDAQLCNTQDRHASQRDWGCTSVGSFTEGASPVGCLDLVGNVWEWTQEAMVIGGSFMSEMAGSVCCECHGLEPHDRESKMGFRCARDVPR